MPELMLFMNENDENIKEQL